IFVFFVQCTKVFVARLLLDLREIMFNGNLQEPDANLGAILAIELPEFVRGYQGRHSTGSSWIVSKNRKLSQAYPKFIRKCGCNIDAARTASGKVHLQPVKVGLIELAKRLFLDLLADVRRGEVDSQSVGLASPNHEVEQRLRRESPAEIKAAAGVKIV